MTTRRNWIQHTPKSTIAVSTSLFLEPLIRHRQFHRIARWVLVALALAEAVHTTLVVPRYKLRVPARCIERHLATHIVCFLLWD